MCQLCLADRVHDFEEVTPAPTTAQRKDLTVNCTFFMRHAVRSVAIFFGAMDFETDLKIFIDCTTWGTTILPMAGTGEDGEGCFFFQAERIQPPKAAEASGTTKHGSIGAHDEFCWQIDFVHAKDCSVHS